MKKRFMTAFLTLALAASMLPANITTALAAGPGEIVSGTPEAEAEKTASETPAVAEAEKGVSVTPAEETVVIESDEEMPVFENGHTHCFCVSGTSCGTDHNAETVWTAWDSATALPTTVDETSHHYYLTKNVSLDNNYTAADGLFLCLNGYTVTMNGHIYKSSGTLTITNCAAKDDESGVRPGGFVQGQVDGSIDYMVSAHDLNLYHVSFSSVNVKSALKMAGYNSSSTTDLPSCYIEDCSFAYEAERNSGYYYAVYYNVAQNITICNTRINGTALDNNCGIYANKVYGKFSLSGSNVTVRRTGTSGGSYPQAVVVTGYSDSVHEIDDCTISAVDEGSAKPSALCLNTSFNTSDSFAATDSELSASTAGNNGVETVSAYCGLTLGDCIITADSAGNGGNVYGVKSGYDPVVLDGCTVTASATDAASTGAVYGIYNAGDLTVKNGSSVSATTAGRGESWGIKFYCQEGPANTLLVSGSAVSGKKYGIEMYDFGGYDAEIDLRDAEISASDKYGIFFNAVPSGMHFYMSGATSITGGEGGFNFIRSSVTVMRPTIHAASKDGNTALAIPAGKTITLYCDSGIVTGDQIISNGMTQALVGQLNLVYPLTFDIDSAGKAAQKPLYYIDTGASNITGCSQYKKCLDPEYEINVYDRFNNYNVTAGVKIYIKAVAKTHYAFDKWIIQYKEGNTWVDFGEGQLLDGDLTASENSFTMPARDIIVKPSFREVPYHNISYKGGAESDGSVADYTGKKYEGEETELSRREFKNKNYKTQTGWSLTDGGALAYALGAVCNDDTITELYPYWQDNHTIILKYGNLVPEGHTAGEVVARLTKYPGVNYLFNLDEEKLFGFELGGTVPSEYYYIIDGDGQCWQLDGMSKNEAGTTLDYVFYTGSSVYTNRYTLEEDITLYPHWQRLYRVSYAPGTYGIEREEPLQDQFKYPGNSNYVTLAGKVNNNNSKVVAYESKREKYQQGGWSRNADGSTCDFALGTKYYADADVTLYPYWEPIYTITYSPGTYGVGVGGNQTVTDKKYHDVSYNIKEAMFMRSGYTQTGWTTDPDGAGERKAPRDNYTVNADLILYPYWERTYAITYVPDEKCDETEPVRDTKYPGVGTKIRSDVFTAEGFTLEGYTTIQGGTDVEYNVEYNYTTDADITLYPVWKAETFALTVGNVQVTSANKADVLGDNTVSYDPGTSTLTLKGAAITTYYALDYGSEGKIGSGIYATSSTTVEDGNHNILASADRGVETLTIVLEGENTLIPAFAGDINGGAGIMTDKVPLTIKGTGKLTINSEIEGDGKTDYAITCSSETYTKSAFCLKSGTLDLTAGDTGIFVTDAKQTGILIEGGTLNATIKHDGGYALATYAMNSMTGIQVNGGTVNLTTLGNKTTETYMGTTYTYTPTLMYVDTYDSDGVVFRGGTVVMENKGTDGYGILINGTYNGGGFGQAAGRPDDDGDSLNEDSFEALGIEDYVGACFIAGDVTIKSKTASIRENADIAGENAPYRSIYLGEGVTVKAGADAAGATAVNNYPTAFASYKYASFTGGTTPAYTLYVGGEAVTAAHLSGTGWAFDPATSTLTLTDADITGVYDDGIDKYSIYSDSDLTIKLAGNSTAGYGEIMPGTAIEVIGDLTFTGTGTLGVIATKYGVYVWHGGIALESGSLFINAGRLALYSSAAVEISGGRLEAQTTDTSNYAISAKDGIRISGGDIVVGAAGDGVDAGYEADMVVSGGTVKISSLYNSVECNNYVQSGGDVSLVVTCDTGFASYDSYALYVDGDITVTGGKLYTEAQYMCIRNSEKDGTVTIRGGLMQAFPRSNTRYKQNPSPTINDFNTFNIYGGRLEITGSSFGIMHKNSMTAVSVNIYGGSLHMDLTKGDRSEFLRVFYGSVYVKMPVSRYSTSLNGSYKIKSGDYTINCSDFDYDYLSVSAIQTISYRPGANGTGEPADIVKDAGVPITLKNAIYTRDGFVQNGWAETDAEDAAKAYDLGEVYSQNADLTLYPTWAEKRTITYNHGSAAETTNYTDPVANGSAVELRGLTYTKSGYVQTGWATTIDAATPEYAFGESITVTADKVLYPVFSNKIHVTYDKGSRGRGDNKTDEVTVGAETTLRGSIFTRIGFSQVGWSLADEGAKAYDLSAKVRVSADMTLYPVWGREYTIAYKPANDAKETAEYSDTVFEGTEITVKEATYTKDRAEQTGWNTRADGKGTGYAFAQKVVMNADLVLYPVFVDIITITYDKGADGTGENVSEETKAGTRITLKEAIFTREGYNQTGWTTVDGGNKLYVLQAETSFTKDTILYPYWEKIPEPEPEPGPEPEPEPEPDQNAKLHEIRVVDGAVAKNKAGMAVRTAREKEVVTITWTPRTAYSFVKWTLDGAVPADATASTTTFVMGTKDVTVSYEARLDIADQVMEELPEGADRKTSVSSLKFEKTKLTLQKNDEAFVNPATAKPAAGKELPGIIYVTGNKDIVAVDQTGNFYPTGLGETTVTAYCGNKKAACKVSVVCHTDSIALMSADDEEISGKTLEMKGGEIMFITVLFDPYDTTDPRAVTWSSNDKSVTVKNGIVTAKEVKAETTADITASVKAVNPADGSSMKVTQTVHVRVTPVDVPVASAADKTHTLALSKKTMKLTTTDGKDSAELKITVAPGKKQKLSVEAGEIEIVSCESSNEHVITVSDHEALAPSGKKGITSVTVSAMNPGTAYVIVRSRSINSGDKENVQRCKVTVTSPANAVAIESGTLDVAESGTGKTITMRKGAKGIVEVELDPGFSTDIGKVKLAGSGGVTVKNGVVFAKKVTRKGKLTVKCGKLKEVVKVTVEK